MKAKINYNPHRKSAFGTISINQTEFRVTREIFKLIGTVHMTCKRKQETDAQIFVGLEDNLSKNAVSFTIKSS